MSTFTISRYCPCGDGEVIGDLRDEDNEPFIDCNICRPKYHFILQMKWDGWEGTYWHEWVLKEK